MTIPDGFEPRCWRETCGEATALLQRLLRIDTTSHPPDSELWDTISQVVKGRDPELEVVPYMIPGFTDGSWFSRLGARWYGFSPVMMDPECDPSFSELFHGIDERIPEDGFHWGLGALWEVVSRFSGR